MKAQVLTAAIRVILRDVGGFGIGAYIAIHEEYTGRASIPLLCLAGCLLGVPGAFALTQLLRGKQALTLTIGSSSDSQEERLLP